MKIKNMKLMLLGLVGLMSASYASATVTPPTTGALLPKDGVTYSVKDATNDVKQDENGRSVNNIVYDMYTIKWTATTGSNEITTKYAYVVGVNSSAADADIATLTIPATVPGDKGTYQVVAIDESWETALNKNTETKTTTLSVDITNFITEVSGDPAKFATGGILPSTIFDGFTKLQSLTITDSYEATATAPAKYTVFNGGFSADAKKTLKTVNLAGSNISKIGDNAFKECVALTGFDFTKITMIGESAFEGDYGFTTLTIPATVFEIGANAFKDMDNKEADPKKHKGLTTLVINGANNTYQTAHDPSTKLTSSVIPAAFSGNTLLTSVTIGSATATEITTGAFIDATKLEVLDLSGCAKLETISGAFPESEAFKTIKLKGTKVTDITNSNINMSKSSRTLETFTFPETLEAVPGTKFKNFIALKEIDLSETKVTIIPDQLCMWGENAYTEEFDADGNSYDPKKYIKPALATVKLNPKTTSIGESAFNGCANLATVEGLNQENLTSIATLAFNGTALTALDLSATKVTEIPAYAFANMAKLASIKLPKTVETIQTAAFAYDAKVSSINLQDTKITILNTIFHEDVVGVGSSTEVAIALSSLTLPETLETINQGALQLLDISEITIPASVTSIGAYALQGCIKLEKFTWNDAQQREIYYNAFRGDDKLKEVKMVTLENTVGYMGIKFSGSKPDGEDKTPDAIFKGNDKSVLKFIVNVEDYNALVADGWTEANLKYCTLTTEGASEFEFKTAGKSGEYYYATYYNEAQATWFPEDKFEVFAAVVEGSNVVMKPFTAEGGYYKVAKLTASNRAICVIRSKEQKAGYELKNADFNDKSTAPAENDLSKATADFTPSRIKYQYKFGSKNGVVAFYRVTSGTIKEGGVYIEASVAAARLNIVFEGEGDATAIEAIANEAENTGAIYNLNGVRVNKAQKGIYIQNGKKFVK